HEGADGGGRGVEDRDVVLVHDLPHAALMGGVRGALVDHLGGPVDQRPVGDVTVPGDPADIGGAPVHIGLRLQVEDVVVGERRLSQVTTGGVQDALGAAGGAGGVEDEEGVLGPDRHRRVFARGVLE